MGELGFRGAPSCWVLIGNAQAGQFLRRETVGRRTVSVAMSASGNVPVEVERYSSRELWTPRGDSFAPEQIVEREEGRWQPRSRSTQRGAWPGAAC